MYTPVAVQHADPAFTHIPIVRKLLSKIPSFGDQFVVLQAEADISIWPRLPYFILALLGRPISDKLDALPLVSTVLLTPLNASVFYALSKKLTGSSFVAVAGTTAALGFRELFVLQPWHWVEREELHKLLIAPPFSNALVNPQISFMLVSLGILALLKLERSPSLKAGAFVSLFYGLSFYTYVYAWTFLTAIFGAVGLQMIYKREWSKVRLLIIVGLVGLMLSTLYWHDVMIFSQSAGFADFQDRFSLGRRPDWPERLSNMRPHLVTLAGLVLASTSRKIGYLRLSIFTVIAESLWKLPIIVGRDIQSLHYAYHYFGPFAGLTIAAVVHELSHKLWKSNLHGMASLFSGFFSISLLVGIGYRTISYASSQYSAYAVDPDIYAAIEFVRIEVEPGSTILAADPEINVRIRNLAPVYVYMASGWGTFATTDEVLTRAAEILRFFEIEPQQFIDSDLYDLDIPGTGAKGLVTPHLLLFNGSLNYPTKESRILALQYVYGLMADRTLTYPVDYVWFGPYERMLGSSDIAERRDLELIYQNKTVTMYQYSSP